MPPPAAALAAVGGGSLKDPEQIPDEIPPKAAKEQIRRVAFLHTPAFVKQRDLFIKFLSQTLTTSKKPMYFRKVLVQEISADFDQAALMERIRASGAVAVLAVMDDAPEAKVKDLSDALINANLMFRAVPSSEVQKKLVALDLMVEMMLLIPG